MKIKYILLLVLLIISPALFSLRYNSQLYNGISEKSKNNNLDKNSEPHTKDFIYGITIDDSWENEVSVDEILDAISAMYVKPTVRIVMSYEVSAAEYTDLFEKIHEKAYIMACPVDSYEMNRYPDAESYLKRFQDSYAALSPYVDIWEIGNEINGIDWIKQENELIASKINSVYHFLNSKINNTFTKIAITAYYMPPGSMEMESWLDRYMDDDIKSGIDYVLVSYYEDDNDGFQPDWDMVFKRLEKIFPNSGLGIGECGNTAEDADINSKKEMAHRYYNMPKYTENYIGGYFWWYWVQDCVPYENNELWEVINSAGYQK